MRAVEQAVVLVVEDDAIPRKHIGRSKIEERPARWLLMAADRLESDELPLTHEFLGVMFGTPRPGVTIALQALERVGLIATRRGHITILDRPTLEQRSNGAYVRQARC